MVGHIPLEDGIGVRVPVPQLEILEKQNRPKAVCVAAVTALAHP